MSREANGYGIRMHVCRDRAASRGASQTTRQTHGTSRPLSSRRPFFTAASTSNDHRSTTLHRGTTMSTTTEPVSLTAADKGYVKPDVLVTTEWVAQHLNDPTVRILESDEDVLLYDLGHIPGAQKIDWHTDLNDSLVRDYVSKEQFQALLRRLGIDDSTTVVFYGDKSNWWATYAFWVFQLFGFTNAKVVDGGRTRWLQESRPTTAEVPAYAPTAYVAPERDEARIRAFKDDALAHSRARLPLIDVRSPDEFTGKKTHLPDYPQ